MKRGLHKTADQLEMQWMDWSVLQKMGRLRQSLDVLQQNLAALLQQTEEHVHLMMENLFLHNNHWKDKHIYGDSMAVWDGDEGVAEAMVKWMVWWGAAEGRFGLYGGAVWGVVGGKHGGGFKDGR
jgi:hypothetical protein